LVIDVDYFKQINDNFGHKSGDAVLRKLAVHGQSLMRGSDIFGRFGGEEFIAILPDTGLAPAIEIAQRLRRTIEGFQWNIKGIEKITVSVGVATLSRDNFSTFKALLKAADIMLFNAKKLGRNQVCSDE
jgi:diguanylate cyclase (GGDEF)-like protein